MKISFLKEYRLIKLIALITAVVLIGADRFTKRLIEINFELGESINLVSINEIIILNLTYVRNTGAAFSILQGQRLFLIITTCLLLTGALIFLLSDKINSKALIIALTLIIGGGAGNLYDRVFYGYVVDFIDFRIINFPIFNFADICAVTGAFLFLFIMLIEEYKISKKKKEDEKSNTDSE